MFLILVTFKVFVLWQGWTPLQSAVSIGSIRWVPLFFIGFVRISHDLSLLNQTLKGQRSRSNIVHAAWSYWGFSEHLSLRKELHPVCMSIVLTSLDWWALVLHFIMFPWLTFQVSMESWHSLRLHNSFFKGGLAARILFVCTMLKNIDVIMSNSSFVQATEQYWISILDELLDRLRDFLEQYMKNVSGGPLHLMYEAICWLRNEIMNSLWTRPLTVGRSRILVYMPCILIISEEFMCTEVSKPEILQHLII